MFMNCQKQFIPIFAAAHPTLRRMCRSAASPLFYPIGIVCDLNSPRFKKNPLCAVIPCRNRFQSSDMPICASVELIYKSCFCNASASEQLGVSSKSSEALRICPNSSVIKGKVETGSYSSDFGGSIFPTVERKTYPVLRSFRKTSQYLGWF